MQIASICTVLYSITQSVYGKFCLYMANFTPFIRLPAPPGALVPIRESRLPASKCTLNVRHTDYSEKINGLEIYWGGRAEPSTTARREGQDATARKFQRRCEAVLGGGDARSLLSLLVSSSAKRAGLDTHTAHRFLEDFLLL